MARFSKAWVFPTFGVIVASACSLSVPTQYVSENEVALPQAMKDISCALKTFQNENSRLNLDTNTIVDQIEVTLQLKASATETSGLAVNTSPAVDPSIMASLGVNYSDTTTLVGERGNTLKITFKNLHTADLNAPGVKAAGALNRRYGAGPRNIVYDPNPCRAGVRDQQPPDSGPVVVAP